VNWADGIIGGCEGCCEEEVQAQVYRGCPWGTEKSVGEEVWRKEDGHFRLIPVLPSNICSGKAFIGCSCNILSHDWGFVFKSGKLRRRLVSLVYSHPLILYI